ncbi:MAG: aminotransferase class I/II-fold pyridoxal phosphate-dependent enzyme [Methermicoccaceae archaeon]
MSASRISKRVSAAPKSGIRKFFDLASSVEDVISLGVGEPDFSTPWHIREACIYSLERGQTSYTSNYGLLALRERIVQHYRERYGLDYSAEKEVLITTGVSEALDIAIRALIDPDDEVLITEPCYVSYVPTVSFAGGIPVYVSTLEEEGFVPSYESISDRITPRTKVLMLNYPNNPTGAVLTKSALKEVADAAVDHDLLVISDEVYSELTYGEEHTCLAQLDGMRERTVVLNGFSKSHAMTGLRIGYALAPEDIIDAMMTVHQYTMLCAPITAQIGAIEALKNGKDSVAAMRREYDRRRRFVLSRLSRMGLECIEAMGAFYLFPSVKRTQLTAEEFTERLLEQQHVVVVPGDVFGPSGKGHVRCSYATSLEELKVAMERMEHFLEHVHEKD